MTLFTSTSRSLYQDCLDNRRVFWVSDPGHAWLAVPVAEIRRLGIAERISGYSYLGSGWHGYDGYALLEEDCDAGVYIDAVTTPEHAFTAAGDFCFDQPRSSGNVAHNVRSLDGYDSRKVT